MRTHKLMIAAFVACFALSGLQAAALAQSKSAANSAASQATTMTVVGKIVKDESMGGYYIQGKTPPEVFRIVNQNPKVLEEYARSGKEVTIAAQSVTGDNLLVQKIQGKPYKEVGMK